MSEENAERSRSCGDGMNGSSSSIGSTGPASEGCGTSRGGISSIGVGSGARLGGESCSAG